MLQGSKYRQAMHSRAPGLHDQSLVLRVHLGLHLPVDISAVQLERSAISGNNHLLGRSAVLQALSCLFEVLMCCPKLSITFHVFSDCRLCNAAGRQHRQA